MSKRNGRSSDGIKPPRLQVPVTELQHAAIKAAAGRASSDVNTWALAYLMPAALASDEAPPVGAPVVVSGKVADRLRSLADQQGVTPDRLLEQLLIARGA